MLRWKSREHIISPLNLYLIENVREDKLSTGAGVGAGADISDSPSLSEEIMANPGRHNLSLMEDSAKVEDTSEMSSLSPIIGNDEASSEKVLR